MKKRKGFTLVELLVGITVFALISAPFLAMFHLGYNLSQVSRRITMAALVGQVHFEQLVGRSPQQLGFDIDGVPGDILPAIVILDGEYIVEIDIEWLRPDRA